MLNHKYFHALKNAQPLEWHAQKNIVARFSKSVVNANTFADGRGIICLPSYIFLLLIMNKINNLKLQQKKGF